VSNTNLTKSEGADLVRILNNILLGEEIDIHILPRCGGLECGKTPGDESKDCGFKSR